MTTGQWLFQGLLSYLAPKFNVAGVANAIAADAKAGDLAVPAALKTRFAVSMLKHATCRVHALEPLDGKPPSVVIIAFHGGAYVANFWPQHWTGYADLADAVERGRVALYLVEYPRVPTVAHTELFDKVEATYREIAALYKHAPIAIVGDSAGGGMTMILAQRLAAAAAKGDEVKQPSSVGLFSPWLDVSGSSPQSLELERSDPFLRVDGLVHAGKLLAGGPRPVATSDPAVSPLFGALTGLPPMTVFTSTHDILFPDSARLRDRVKAEHVQSAFRYREKTGLTHCWWMWGGKGLDTIKELAAFIRLDCSLSVAPA